MLETCARTRVNRHAHTYHAHTHIHHNDFQLCIQSIDDFYTWSQSQKVLISLFSELEFSPTAYRLVHLYCSLLPSRCIVACNSGVPRNPIWDEAHPEKKMIIYEMFDGSRSRSSSAGDSFSEQQQKKAKLLNTALAGHATREQEKHKK